MKAYHGSVILQFDSVTTGNAGALMPVKVELVSGGDASLFNLDGVAIANPIATDSKGNYAFKLVDEVYNIIINQGTSAEEVLRDVSISTDPTFVKYNLTVIAGQTLLPLPSPINSAQVFIDGLMQSQASGAYTFIDGSSTITLSQAMAGDEIVEVWNKILTSTEPSSRATPYVFSSMRALLNTDLSGYTFVVGDWIETQGRAVENDGGGSTLQVVSSVGLTDDYETILPLTTGLSCKLISGGHNKLHNDNMEVIAHRGFDNFNIEGTMYAFQSSLDYGADALECDIQISYDGYAVLYHDADTMTSDMSGITGKVSEALLADIQAATFKQLAGNILVNKIFIPLYSEILDLCQQSGAKVYAEIKAYRTQADIAIMVQAIVARGLEDSVLLMSFRFTDIEFVRSINKNINIGYIIDGYTGSDSGGSLKSVAFDFIKRDKNAHMNIKLSTMDNPSGITPNPEVAAFQAAGVFVMAWTVESQVDVIFARRNNVNGLISAIPISRLQTQRINHGSRI